MTITPEAILVLLLLAAVVWTIYRNERLSARLEELNKDCIEVMTATEKTLQLIQITGLTEDRFIQLRATIELSRDQILEKLKHLSR